MYFLEVSHKKCFVFANTPPPQTLLTCASPNRTVIEGKRQVKVGTTISELSQTLAMVHLLHFKVIISSAVSAQCYSPFTLGSFLM